MNRFHKGKNGNSTEKKYETNGKTGAVMARDPGLFHEEWGGAFGNGVIIARRPAQSVVHSAYT